MPTIAQELAGSPFDVVDDPEGARQVVGLRLRPGVRDPERALLALHRRLRHLAGDYGVRSVDLPGPVAGRHWWEEMFWAKVRLRRPVGLLRLPAGVLSAPVGAVERSALAWRVREALSERLGGPAITLGDIARTIAVHPRTVQRGLLDEGLTFAEVLDCVRRGRALEYLTGTDRPLAEISARLGFAEPAVLSRCARRWWGRTPSEVRAGHRRS
jgi:AraC-like DNA-binding protein